MYQFIWNKFVSLFYDIVIVFVKRCKLCFCECNILLGLRVATNSCKFH